MLEQAHKVIKAIRSIDPRMEAQTFDHLVTIALQPGITVTQLAHSVENSDGCTSRNVRKLVELGLVRKVFDEHDGRVRRCYLTENGKGFFR